MMLSDNSKSIFRKGNIGYVKNPSGIYKVDYEKETVIAKSFEEMLFDYAISKTVFKKFIKSYIRVCQSPEIVGFDPDIVSAEADLDAITDLLFTQGAELYEEEQEVFQDYSSRKY